MVVSWTFPAVSSTTSARPRPSVSACTLVVSPPRERPMAWSAGSATTTSPSESVNSGAPATLLVVVGLTAHGRGVAADPAGAGPVLVHPHQRGVRRDQPVQLAGGVGVGLGAGQQPGPGAIGAPPGQPLVGGLPRPEALLGQLPPGRAGAVLPGDRLDHLPVIAPPPARPTCRRRQQGLDPGPRLIRDHRSMLAHRRKPDGDNRQDPSDTP